MRNFFRKGNLIALRELALRRTADRVDDEMLEYRRDAVGGSRCGRRARRCWLCVGPGERGEKLVRSRGAPGGAARRAVALRCYVETPALQRLPDERAPASLRVLKLAQELGADHRDAGRPDARRRRWSRYAREHNLSRVVLGRDTGAGAGRGGARWPNAVARSAPTST